MKISQYKRVLGFVAGLLFLSAALAGAENIKIGTIDAQRILENTKAGKKVKVTLEEYVKSRQKIIDLEEQELKNFEEELKKQLPVLSAEAKKDKQEGFQKKILDYQKKVTEVNNEVQNKKKEVLEDFNKTLEQIAKNIAEKEGYTVILDRNSGGGVIVYAKESVDITDRVIQEFDKRFQ